MRILFVGHLWPGSTSLQRMIALGELGHAVVGVSMTPRNRSRERWLPVRILYRLGYPPDLTRANRQILNHIKGNSFDVIWVEKGLTISPRTLIAAKSSNPRCQLVFFSPDNMMYWRNQSRHYMVSLPLYDLHVTTKSHNVAKLKILGAKDVLFVNNAYDPHTHRPMSLTAEEKAFWGAEVGFVGEFERPRLEIMLGLAKAEVPVTVRGPEWELYVGRHSKLVVRPGWVYGDDYARSICATKINLCFLRKIVGDLQTARSVEIPACGAFMLAERTDEHLALFQEGKEAEFFGSQDELLDKVKYYLIHDSQREQIAAAGRERCLRSGYGNHDRIRVVLEYLQGKSTNSSSNII